MLHRPMTALVASLAATLFMSTLALPDAEAKTPFDGKIIMSDKRYPLSAKSKSEYFAKLRKQSKTKFMEDKENKQWKIHFAAFFKKPLNDLEVTIKIYDVTEKQKRLVVAFEQYLDRRNQNEIISHVKLDRQKFGVNRKLLIVVENRNHTLAQGTFQILGEAEKYSGKVEFTEEETKGP
jgi:hypothetical protein